MLGLWLIERFALLMVILFISLELSPWVCLHQRLAGSAAVFGQGITLMDGELGGEEQALLETELRDARWTWAEWGGGRTLQGLAFDLAGEGNLSACDSRQRGGWRLLLPGPYPWAPKAYSKLQVAPLG